MNCRAFVFGTATDPLERAVGSAMDIFVRLECSYAGVYYVSG